MSARALVLIATLLIAVRVVAVIGGLREVDAGQHRGMFQYDAEQYQTLAHDRGTPYRDFEVSFPPVAFGAMKLIGAGKIRATLARLAWSALVADLLVAAAVAFGWGRRAALWYLVLGLPFALFPFAYFRIDFAAVALATWGLALVNRGEQASGGAALAAAMFTKVWPVAVVPGLVVCRRIRAFITWLAVSALGLAGWLILGGLDGPRQVFTFKGAHGWQIESVVGSVVRVISGGPARFEQGAWRTGTAPQWASILLGVALLGGVAVTWSAASRAPRSDQVVWGGIAPLVATTVFLVCAPILSPQYLTWLVPFAAICAALGAGRLAVLTGSASLLTVLIGRGYANLAAGIGSAQLLLVVRNGLLLAILLSGWAELRNRRSVPAGPSEPVPAPV